MTDQWVPGPPPVPAPPIAGLPPANSWNQSPPCSTGNQPSIVASIIITDVPATILAPYAWRITLNDGNAPPNFTIDRLDSSGNLIDSPVDISGVDGSVAFADPVYLAQDPVAPMEAATKEYVDANTPGFMDAPLDGQLYGRASGAWATAYSTANPANYQTAAQVTATLASYMPLSGGTFTGPAYFPANNSVLIAGAATTQRAILGLTGSVARWQLMLGDQTAESGGNAGSNFALNAVSDGGGLLSTPLAIARATGAITVGVTSGIVPMTLNGPAGSWRSIAGSTNGSLRWQMYLGNPTGELGGNFGSNFQLNAYSDTGALIYSPLQIARQTGVATFSALPSFPGGLPNYVLVTNGAGVLAWAPNGMQEAPVDGQFYSRQNAAWAVAPGGMTDAPNDGTAYARKSQAWAHLAHTDITDWTATLAPYALTTSVPVASTTTPIMDGTAAVGTGTTWARADHVHPSDTSRVAKSGDTMTGPLTLAADPTAALGAATKQYVDASVMGDNRIINGDMRIDQRNNGAVGTAGNVYTVDRWAYSSSQTAKGNWGRQSSSAPGFPYHLNFSSTSTYSLLASDNFNFVQPIEADMVSDFQWGTPNAQPVTLSFWAYSNQAGTFGGALKNYPSPSTRSYPFTYALAANTWTRIVITIPGDVAGTWVMSGNAASLSVNFDLGNGSTFRGPANAWASANYLGATGSVSIAANNGASFSATGVKLEIGNVATPFSRQTMAKRLADCQRYYYDTGAVGGLSTISFNATVAGTIVQTSVLFPVTMRASATIVLRNTSFTGVATAMASASSTQGGFLPTITASAAGQGRADFNYSASGEL